MGYLVASIEELDAAFPDARIRGVSLDGKVTHEWVTVLKGEVVTIYDYKWVAEPGRKEQFHVGGHSRLVLKHLKELFPKRRVCSDDDLPWIRRISTEPLGNRREDR
jgi:hypothetical protein